MAQESKEERAENGETHTVRLSFRSTPSNADKITVVAEALGWLNAIGGPNVSRVLNFLIDQFDVDTLKRLKKKMEEENGRRK